MNRCTTPPVLISGLWSSYLGFDHREVHDHDFSTKVSVSLVIDENLTNMTSGEGYLLTVTSEGILIKALTAAGVFYGALKVYQLLSTNADNELPGYPYTITPVFNTEGFHLDVSPHFMPIDFVYELIDYMAMHKLNIFHWQLVDDQELCIEIKKYPKLTEVVAWRVNIEDRALE